MTVVNKAEVLFEAERNHSAAETDLWDYLKDELEINMCLLGEFGNSEEISYDYYDASIEFKGAPNEFLLTEEQVQGLWAYGFIRCWVNYTDNTEIYYNGNHVSERKLKAGWKTSTEPAEFQYVGKELLKK